MLPLGCEGSFCKACPTLQQILLCRWVDCVLIVSYVNLLLFQSCCLEDGSPSDGHSSSSDLMELLLQEDSRSGTSSTSTGSASNGCNTSNSGRGEHEISTQINPEYLRDVKLVVAILNILERFAYYITHKPPFIGCTGSSNTSKYFGSVDSSENDLKEKRKEDGQNFKYVLQDPLWLLMANADDKVMMTYQVPAQ